MAHPPRREAYPLPATVTRCWGSPRGLLFRGSNVWWEQEPEDGSGLERLPPAGTIPGGIELVGNLPERIARVAQQLGQLPGLLIGRMLAGVTLHGRPPLGHDRGREVLRRAQRCAARLLGLQRVFGALGDGLTLVLGDDGKQAHGQGIRVGHVAADEVHARVAQGEDEAGIAREAVELGDEQGAARAPGFGDGGQQLRALVLLPALHFHKLRDELRGVGHEGAHGRALRFQAQAGLALLLGGDSIIRSVQLGGKSGAHVVQKSKTKARYIIYVL